MIPDHLTDAATAQLTNAGLVIYDHPRLAIQLAPVDGPAPSHVVIGLGPLFVHTEVAWNREDADAVVAELMPHPSVAQVTSLPIVDRRG